MERNLISSLSSLASNSAATFLCFRPRTSARNWSDRMEMSGFFSPAAVKTSMISPSGHDRLGHQLANGVVEMLPADVAFAGAVWPAAALMAWKKRDVVAQLDGLVRRGAEGEGSGKVGHHLHKALLAVFLLQERVPAPAGIRAEPFCAGVPVVQLSQLKPCMMPQAISCFSCIAAMAWAVSMLGVPWPPLSRVGGQGMFQLVGEAEIIHHQAAWFVAEDPVHPRDGLHQPVAAHRLVGIHRVQARRVEAGQPHVAHDHDAERVLAVFEPTRQLAALSLLRICGCHSGPSSALPVMTILTTQSASSRLDVVVVRPLAHSGRSLMIAL